jgi:hypothetical protein
MPWQLIAAANDIVFRHCNNQFEDGCAAGRLTLRRDIHAEYIPRPRTTRQPVHLDGQKYQRPMSTIGLRSICRQSSDPALAQDPPGQLLQIFARVILGPVQ